MKKILSSILLAFVLVLAVVSAAGDLTVTIAPTSQNADPGDTLTYTLTFTNDGQTNIDSITVTSGNLIDGANTIPAPNIDNVVDLVPLTPQDVVFTVDVPIGTPAGTYDGVITATDDDKTTNTFTITYSVVVNSVDSFTVDPTSMTFNMVQDDTELQTFVIENTGSSTLTGITATFMSDDGDIDFIEDNDNDQIDFTITDVPSTLGPGAQATVTVRAVSDDNIDEGNNYDGTVTVSAQGVSDVLIDVNVDIDPSFCEDGRTGSDIDIQIDEPDSGDEYAPGDTVTVQIEIDNNENGDLDFEVEVMLYNEDQGDIEDTVKEDISIDEDDSESLSIDIDIPSNIDADDNYQIIVQVHEDGNEDEICDYETVDIDIELEKEDAHIEDLSISPDAALMCSDSYTVTVDVESTGENDLEDVYVELIDSDLEVSETSVSFDLGDYNDNDNDYRLTFDLEVPGDLDDGTYYLEAQLFEDNGDLFDSELIAIDVICAGSGTTIPTSPTDDGTLKVTVANEYDVSSDELTLSLVIENEGSTTKEVDIDVEDVSWANLDEVEVIDMLNPGDQVHAYLYFTLDTTTEGEHDIRITVTDDDGNSISKTVTVDFGFPPEDDDPLFSGLSTWFNEKTQGNKVFWIIADIVLIILALVFLRMLFSKR